MDNSLNTYIKNQILIRPEKLNEDLEYNHKKFNKRTDYYQIIKYINDFIDGKNINRYIILPGIRDTGKTTLLFQIYDYLLKEKDIKPKNILYISGDRLKKIGNYNIYEAITAYINNYHNSILETIKEPIFILIDEAQYDSEWSLTGKIIFDATKNIFMIFSGSSALQLSYNADSARRLLNIPINPLNYSQHLKLKYSNFENDISQSIINIIFNGTIENSEKLENRILNIYTNFKNFEVNEWLDYLKFGGFPSSFYQNQNETSKKLIDMINRVVTIDMNNIEGISTETKNLAFQILYFFAFQDPCETSKGSLANQFDTNKKMITKVLDILEKTKLIFHIETFTSSAKRTLKPNKYYFATPSLKHNLALDLGNASLEDETAYLRKLFENYVASSFYNLDNRSNISYKTYYDINNKKKKGKNVDFIMQRNQENPIPIEVSFGKKNKSQIKYAISRYKSPYGIIISNNEENIKKEDDVIYLPTEIFALM